MNDLIERLAREAGIREERYMTNPPRPTGAVLCSADAIERFAALVAEQCALVVEDFEEASEGTAAPAIRSKFPMPKG